MDAESRRGRRGDDGAQVSMFIDGLHVQVKAGSTIMDAAASHDVFIPTLCHDPRLEPAGRCGLCKVQVAGLGIVQACETTVAEGMEVTTLDPTLAALRRERLNEILSNHNAYCEPPCHYACPAGIDIPRYLDAIARSDDIEAVRIIKERLPLPRIIGRVCPRPCERACRRTQVDGEAVAICQLKRFSADRVHEAREAGIQRAASVDPMVAPATGKRVAIVGSGPTGLSAAYYLALDGHDVTIFEALDRPGGMVLNGIQIGRAHV